MVKEASFTWSSQDNIISNYWIELLIRKDKIKGNQKNNLETNKTSQRKLPFSAKLKNQEKNQ